MNQTPACTVIDGRGLEPPEPFVRTMAALDAMGAGESVLLLLPREPHPLYQALERQAFLHQTQRTVDGVFEIRIWRKTD